MYEKLEGRVLYENSEDGVHIQIPVRRGPFAAVYGPMVGIWLGLATIRYWRLLAGPHPEDINFKLQLVAIAIYVVGFVYFLLWLVWTLTGETLITLKPPTLKIQTRVFGVLLATRIFETHQIHRMRFVPHSRVLTQQSVINPNSSYICFETTNQRQKFAKGVSAAEARALIDKMLLVYEFPRSWF